MEILQIWSLVYFALLLNEIGCDTIVEMNGKILEKPKSIDNAVSMLTELSGKTHNVFSGVALICKQYDLISS